MNYFIKPALISFAAIGTLMLPATPTLAESAFVEAAAKRVNLAGGQRMLSQRIAMSACFVAAGVDESEQFERLESAYAEFTHVHDVLRNGSEELGLEEEGYRTVLQELDAVDASWSDYQEMVDGFIQIRMMTPEIMTRFDERGLNVLDGMNVTVSTIATKYSADLEELPQILALTIDFASRQEMLTQKMAKEFCLVTAGINTEENRELLKQSDEQFNLILAALIDGIPQLVTPAPTAEILAHLQAVEVAWEAPKHIFERAINGEEISWEDRQFISENIDVVLSAMADTVELYEDVHGLPNF